MTQLTRSPSKPVRLTRPLLNISNQPAHVTFAYAELERKLCRRRAGHVLVAQIVDLIRMSAV